MTAQEKKSHPDLINFHFIIRAFKNQKLTA